MMKQNDENKKNSWMSRLRDAFLFQDTPSACPSHSNAQIDALHSLLMKGWVTEAELTKRIEALGMETAGRRFIALNLCIDGFRDLFRRHAAQKVGEIVNTLYSACLDALESAYCAVMAEGEIGVILVRDRFHEESLLREALAPMRELMQRDYGLTLTIGVGTHAMTPDVIHESYRNAHIASRYRMIFGPGQHIEYEKIQMRIGENAAYPDRTERDIIDALRKSDKARFKRELNSFFDIICAGSVNYIPLAVMSLCMRMFQSYASERSAECDLSGLYAELSNCADRFELLRVVGSFGLNNMTEDHKNTDTRNAELAQKIIAYVNDNFPNPDLSVVSIADHIKITQNAVRLILKDALGVSPRDYIERVRMETACKLLRETELTAKDIAERVGYKESRYFYSVFKKYSGLTAYEYRTKV